MTSPKQDERPKTLIEYMGFKDPDLQDFTHDEWCLKLLNPKLLEKIVENKLNIFWQREKEEIIKIELEHVIVKRGYNGYTQRLGFIDVFYQFIVRNNDSIFSDLFIIIFEVKTSKQTVGSIAREIEYYRDAVYDAERSTGHRIHLTPFLVAKEKLPITQFQTITFDEILQLEKEIEQEKQ